MKPRNLILIPFLLCTAILGPAATGAEARKKSAYSDSNSDGRISVAVYPIKPAGANPNLASALTALLASMLTPSPQLRVIDEAMLKTVMQRLGTNPSDACDSTACQDEIGKLVKAQKIITGDLSQLGNTYVLGLKVVDVQTGSVEFSTQDRFSGSEDQLDQLMSAAAGKVRSHFEGGAAAAYPSTPASAAGAFPATTAPAASARIESSDGEYPTDCPPAGKKYFVAVYPIKAAGSDAALAVSMSSLLGSRLTRSSQLNVVEEAMLKAVIERQGLNASDACDDTSCQVSVGKLVKAQKIIMGDLTKFGQKFILSLKLVNVETGVTEFSSEAKCTCSEDDLELLVDAAVAKVRNHFCEQVVLPALPQGQSFLPAPTIPLQSQSQVIKQSQNQPSIIPEDASFIYLRNSTPMAVKLLFLDKELKGGVGTKDCIKISISPGNHILEYSNPMTNEIAATAKFTSVPKAIYYFEIPNALNWHLNQKSENEASRWATLCHEPE